MASFFSSISQALRSSFSRFTVHADEDELVDPQETLREKCKEKPECAHYEEKLAECNDRVGGKTQTSETCFEEVVDFMHCVDHCVSKTLFSHLK